MKINRCLKSKTFNLDYHFPHLKTIIDFFLIPEIKYLFKNFLYWIHRLILCNSIFSKKKKNTQIKLNALQFIVINLYVCNIIFFKVTFQAILLCKPTYHSWINGFD